MVSMKETLLTGFEAIDKDFGGLRPKEVTLIGGRPAMGKTTLALQIALNVARSGKSVLYIAAEGGPVETSIRLASIISEIPFSKIRTWDLTDDEWDLFRKTVEEIKRLPIQFYYTDIMQMIRCRSDDDTKPQADLVIFDYLQLIKSNKTGSKDVAQNRAPRKYLREFKKIAKNHKIPVVVLSQLSRKLERRKDKHPTIKDFRVKKLSVDLFDQVFLLYRDGYYDLNAPADKAELIGVCPKRNLKKTGTIRWNSEKSIFE